MSGFDDAGTPPEVPEEYAATYRDAYLRALQEGADAEAPAPFEVAPEPDELVPLAPADGNAEPTEKLVPLLISAAVLAVVVAIVVVLALLTKGDGKPSPTPATGQPQTTPQTTPGGTPTTHPRRTKHPRPTSSATATSGGQPAQGAWQGAVVPITPQAVTASCTAKPGVDSGGKKVDYEAANTIDGDASTAWRCDGSATGVTLTITIPSGTNVAEVGLIPGYAKTDPDSGADRYAENNRITKVRWTFGDGRSVEQVLDPAPKNRSMQTIRVPETQTGTVTLQVLAVARGPRNTTAISELEVQAAG